MPFQSTSSQKQLKQRHRISLEVVQLSKRQLLSFHEPQAGVLKVWHKAEGMPNATAFIATDRYLLPLDAEGQNPRRKADEMPITTCVLRK